MIGLDGDERLAERLKENEEGEKEHFFFSKKFCHIDCVDTTIKEGAGITMDTIIVCHP